MNAPLQLERYVFTRLDVEVNPDFTPQQQQEVSSENPVKLKLDLGLGENKEDPTKFNVAVGVDELRLEKGALPYRIAFRVVGQFSVRRDFKPNDLKRVVQVNGASMLYSAARELVLIVTGRGPWSGYLLPTVSFQHALAEMESQKGKASDQPGHHLVTELP